MSIITNRTRLPETRPSITHDGIIHYTVEGPDGEKIAKTLEMCITIGLHPRDKRPRELFIRNECGVHLFDEWAIAISLIWQMDPGSLEHTIRKFAHIRKPPNGMSEDPRIGFAKSPYDYIMRWVAAEFLPEEDAKKLGVHFQ